jgi:hypothetical protein
MSTTTKLLGCVGLLLALHLQSRAQLNTEATKKGERDLERNIQGDRFRIYNNYVSFGAGIAQTFAAPTKRSIPFAFNYNFGIRKQFFQIGYMRSEPPPVLWGNYTENFLNDLHVAYSIRRETKALNIAYIGGLSYAWGLSKNTPYSSPGLYVEGQAIRKVAYDLGIGFAIFASYNPKFSCAGLRLEFFFSSAYKGKVNG